MVKFNVRSDNNENEAPPDIFHAAQTDDPRELAQAIQAGQTLNDVDRSSLMTPVHVACVSRSRSFLKAAEQLPFDPWKRDANQRLAIDHARAQGLRDAQRALFEKMYPPGWDNDGDVVQFPAQVPPPEL